MQIIRTEAPTGGPDRTPREEIVSLFTGHREVEPEQYKDCSASEGWAWLRNPGLCTFKVQLGAMKSFGQPFAILDSQAGNEKGGGGIATYPFNNMYLPLSDKRDEEGNLVIDVNPDNFDERMAYFMSMYPQCFRGGAPIAGGTEAMEAVKAGDKHFMGEFGKRARADRPIRGRVMWSDGMLNDAAAFKAYLAQATLGTGESEGLGVHGEWDEAWAVAILGEGEDERGDDHGKEAYDQYADLAKDHPWIHPYYFQAVANGDEVAEDMALAVVPTQAG
jgi:hypothetical protein